MDMYEISMWIVLVISDNLGTIARILVVKTILFRRWHATIPFLSASTHAGYHHVIGVPTAPRSRGEAELEALVWS